jgi:hypothetical protein
LGHGDFQTQEAPTKIKTLEEKQVTAISVGDDFCIALGLTLPFSELLKISKQNQVERARSLSSDNKYQIKRLKSRSPSSQYTDKPRSIKQNAIQPHAKLQMDYKPYA